jgi:hypothetical protein
VTIFLAAFVFWLRRRMAAAPGADAHLVTWACSSCGKKLRAKEEALGKRVRCPGCGQSMDVPA